MAKLTINEFLSCAAAKHGNTYAYDKVHYVNSRTKVIITCDKHGDFHQRPGDHLNGQGCPSCKYDRARKDKTFIESAKKIHGDKYDYSKVEYHRTDQKVTITCPIHGSWNTKPSIHLSGHGCPKCGRCLTQEEFLQKAFDVHGPKYDYTKTKFTETRDAVIITCSKHGDFIQRASAHLNGNGCKRCQDDSLRMTTEQFIEKSCKIHGTRFDYSKVDYKRSHEPVIIICPIHGEFSQKAYMHLQSKGCRACKYLNHPGGYTYDLFKTNKTLAETMGIYYVVQYDFHNESFLKIGITQFSAYIRHKSYWKNVTILSEIPMKMQDAFHKEQMTINRIELRRFRYRPKNIKAELTECFTIEAKPFLF